MLDFAVRQISEEANDSTVRFGFERQARSELLAAALDQVEHGMLLLDASATVLHVNRAGLTACASHAKLCIEGGRLRGRSSASSADAALARGLAEASRSRRTLLHFGEPGEALPLLLTPLGSVPIPAQPILAMFGRPDGCDALKVTLFARATGLTQAEANVLQGLCCGLAPGELASRHGVALSTVRTQIYCIRQKTRTRNIRALVALVQGLPPSVGVLN